MICGIDEAGRGPVIGPLVMAGVVLPKDKIPLLKNLGVKDSKLVPKSKRQKLFDEIIKLADSYCIVEASPKEIDQHNAVGTNLNQLEAMKAAKIVQKLLPNKVILDSPEPANGGKKFGYMVRKHLSPELAKSIEIVAEHKADMNYLIVGAASILAKVTRDKRIVEIKKLAGIDFGSGYPSDPLCKKFLEEHFEGNISEHIRKCWGPYIEEKEKREQRSVFDF